MNQLLIRILIHLRLTRLVKDNFAACGAPPCFCLKVKTFVYDNILIASILW